MIKTVCKKCGSEKSFNEDKFGKKFKCPNCGNIVQIEESTINVTSFKASAQSNDLSKEHIQPPKLPSTSNFPWKQVIVVLIALGLIIASIFLYFNFKEKSCWNEAKILNSSKGYSKYLTDYPNGKYVKEANDSISLIQKKENPLMVRIFARTGIFYNSEGWPVEPGKVDEVKGYNELKTYKKKGTYDYIQRIQFDGISDNISIQIENIDNKLIFSNNNFMLKNDVVYSAHGFNSSGAIEQDKNYQKWMSDNRNGLLKIKVLYKNKLLFNGTIDQRDQPKAKNTFNSSEVVNKTTSPPTVLNKNSFVTDIDGNVYKTIKIGTQTWMAENLRTTKYRNGNPIPNVVDNAAWQSLTTGAYCWYNNEAASNKNTYGALYNWYSVTDSRNIAPAGFHVASDAEWTKLENYLVSVGVPANGGGGALKETGFSHWSSPNKDATNSIGFKALPGGGRVFNGQFAMVGTDGIWWNSTGNDSGSAWSRRLFNSFPIVFRFNSNKQFGLSVRCVKD